MAVDLGAGRRMEVTGYALRHGGHAGYQLRSWELQGSAAAEGAEWVTLDKRQGDKTLPSRATSPSSFLNNYYDAGYWAVNQATNGAVRHVRILQTGYNSGNNVDPNVIGGLMCGGLELYGVLREV